MKKMYKLVIFDMDGTLLNGRTIFKIAEEKGFMDKLNEIMNSRKEAYKKSIAIAKLLKCMTEKEFLKMFREIPLNKNAEIVVERLREKDIKTAIITDSYHIAALDLKKRLSIDYAFSNELVMKDGHITGEIILHNKNPVKKFEGCSQHSICKKEVMKNLCMKLNIEKEETVAIGDSVGDACMLKEAGLGIAFNGSNEIKEVADVCINDLIEILKYIDSV